MPDDVAHSLRLINRALSEVVDRLQQEGLNPLQHKYLSSLRASLAQGGACIRKIGVKQRAEPKVQAELSQYRNHLRDLMEILSVSQGRLLAEKARLHAAGERQRALQAWAQAQER